MSTLFEETAINGMAMPNRMIRSATWEGMCDVDGRPTGKLIDFYRVLAQGGIGLIVSGYTFVRQDGKQMPGKMGIHTDDFEPEMVALSSAVHDEGGKICVQLVHAGGQTNTETAGRQPLAPSAVQVDQFSEIPSELSKDDIFDIVAAFGEGARRAKRWGFDAVQLHGAHGYLINQFLSPLTNRRTDDYGGSIENRARIVLEVLGGIRQTTGKSFPVLIKMNSEDFVEGGFSRRDMLDVCKMLESAGIDAIELSGGTSFPASTSPCGPGNSTHLTAKSFIGKPPKITKSTSRPL